MNQHPETEDGRFGGEAGQVRFDVLYLLGASTVVGLVSAVAVGRWGPARRFEHSHLAHLIRVAGAVAVGVVLIAAVLRLAGRRRPAKADRGERGSAVLEAVIGAPVVILLLVALIGAARVANAHQVVDDAAGDAARAASAARTTAAADMAAQQTATASMSGRGVSCTPMTVNLDVSNWRPGGTVAVSLTCTARLADLGVPILGGTRTVTGRAASVIDTYRQLGP